jgi:uncharacterized membrane protein YhaH (DUF805 family)
MIAFLGSVVANPFFSGLLAQADGSSSPQGGGMGIVGTIIYLAILVAIIAGIWKAFEKAGQPGWAAIIPIYNAIVMLKIAGKPAWWVLLFFVPIVNLVITFIAMIALAKSFGKGAGYGIGCVFLGFIFIPMLGFGSAKYIGPQP